MRLPLKYLETRNEVHGVLCFKLMKEISGLQNLYDYYGESDMESGIFDDSVGANDSGESKASNNMEVCFMDNYLWKAIFHGHIII
jgi:hypothetical protein